MNITKPYTQHLGILESRDIFVDFWPSVRSYYCFLSRKIEKKPTTTQGCAANAEVMLRARENFIVCCVKGCREIQKQVERNFVIVKRGGKNTGYVKEDSLSAVPGQVSRLMDARLYLDRCKASC